MNMQLTHTHGYGMVRPDLTQKHTFTNIISASIHVHVYIIQIIIMTFLRMEHYLRNHEKIILTESVLQLENTHKVEGRNMLAIGCQFSLMTGGRVHSHTHIL